MINGITWVDMAWYMLWPDGHIVWSGGHGMVYGMAWLA